MVLVTIFVLEDIMRKILAVTLALSPVLFAASAIASQPAAEDATPAKHFRVSSGVTPAKVLYSPASISLPNTPFTAMLPPDMQVEVKLTVDESGVAHDIQVVNATNAELDARVLTAVQKIRFSPARLDDQAVAAPIDLKVEVVH
jgi:TonB family protein